MSTGTISGIKRMEIHDGDGLRTTVFLKGCPLKCLWCHNPESLSGKPQIAYFKDNCIRCGVCTAVCPQNAIYKGKIDHSTCSRCGTCVEACPTEALKLYGEEIEAEVLIERLMQDASFWKNGNGGVTLSGGECLMQPQFTTELAFLLHSKGISVNIDTCGYVPQTVFDKILPYTDTFLYDIKAIDPTVHKNCTGVDNSIILSNLHHLSQKNAKIEIRIPLVKGYNDSEIPEIGKFLSQLKGITKVKVLKYHSFAASRYDALNLPCTLPNTETSPEDLKKAVNILKDCNLNATIE